VNHKNKTVIFLSKNKSGTKARVRKPAKIVSRKRSTTVVSGNKLTRAQSTRVKALLAKLPPIEKIDPEIYAKLQLTIHETVEKTVPEYSKWVNSSLGRRVVAEDCPTPLCSSCGNDCPTPLCSSCGNDCPTPLKNIDDRVVKSVNQALNAAIRQALNERLKQGNV
jgi:hypothetical protein